MDEHPNVVAVRDLMDAFDAMDVERIRAGLADDVTWHMIGGKTTEGIEALESMMTPMAEDFSISADVHDIVGNDEHVVALVNATARSGDEEFSYRTAEILHVKDGKITERWAFSDDTEAINRFFAQFS
jgi:ketosteroid isomerase-like protein